jgi:uncharacterized PurR-regulated membrane protein YhhQ (DUF165 family)
VIYVLLYIGSIAAINFGFSQWHDNEVISLALSTGIGGVFILRDLVQRRYGHGVLLAMLAAVAVSYLTSDPYVATASALAFLVSEAADWAVYTVTKRPLSDRVLLSSAVSVPLDTVVFLGVLGLLIPQLIAVQIASKFGAALVVWGGLKWRRA